MCLLEDENDIDPVLKSWASRYRQSPAQEGSSIGMSKANHGMSCRKHYRVALEYRWMLCPKAGLWVRKLTVAILNDEALPSFV